MINIEDLFSDFNPVITSSTYVPDTNGDFLLKVEETYTDITPLFYLLFLFLFVSTTLFFFRYFYRIK